MFPLRDQAACPSPPPLLPLLLLALGAGACATAPGARAPAAPSDEASVRAGLNENFLSPDLDVERFVRVFEGESREIFLQRAALVELLELRPGMEVADVGAGTGLFLRPLADAVGARGRVFAVDISPRFIEHIEQRKRAEGLDRVRTVLCGERSADLDDESVDRILVCDTYHHFEYPGSTLASLWRALRPGGMLVVVEFERVPYVSRPWILDHVRAGRRTFAREIEAAGFVLADEPRVDGFLESYVLRFRKP